MEICHNKTTKKECENVSFCTYQKNQINDEYLYNAIKNYSCVVNCDRVNKLNCRNTYFYDLCTRECLQHRALHAVIINNISNNN